MLLSLNRTSMTIFEDRGTKLVICLKAYGEMNWSMLPKYTRCFYLCDVCHLCVSEFFVGPRNQDEASICKMDTE